ncbi:hypothetical protein A3D71_03395 [Candidatus Kaiserbacteria bacterium RIFCSPHIGHO2_02_FULL_55_20]|uniref:Uncharacterized protein n=1 Tax=Candidatus Kaiserbacteria bacterium RIFCSPHIGHO2_02_FULL_55_20 TaxID=1798497 RepID=A0A1F6DXG8_9BACT|nr:MAG: hypothetical protein A2680_03280 [Candidatus Kaiserbacteria bacterium RIFCSPHIGHO2_01_FULL_55_37]OGG66108.1 MAG: hypothetical protein A3D71_03395 [Candidatus Kaiserbacteria bacterium RIFCSPHIGHO2_02_FULL_55_20]
MLLWLFTHATVNLPNGWVFKDPDDIGLSESSLIAGPKDEGGRDREQTRKNILYFAERHGWKPKDAPAPDVVITENTTYGQVLDYYFSSG